MKRPKHDDSDAEVVEQVSTILAKVTSCGQKEDQENATDAKHELLLRPDNNDEQVERCRHLGRIEELETAQMLAKRRIYELEREIQLRQPLEYEHCLLREVSNARKVQRENVELRKMIRSMHDSCNELELERLKRRLESAEQKTAILEEELGKCEKLQQYKDFLTAGLSASELKRRLQVYNTVSETLDDMRLTLDVSEQSLIVVRSRLEKTQHELRTAEAERDQALESIRALEKTFNALRNTNAQSATSSNARKKDNSELLEEVRKEFTAIRQNREKILRAAQKHSPVVSRAVNTSPPVPSKAERSKTSEEERANEVAKFERQVQAETRETTIPPLTHNWHKIIYDSLQLHDKEWKNIFKSMIGVKDINVTEHYVQVILQEGEEIMLEKGSQGAMLNVLSEGWTLKQIQERLRKHLTE